MDPLAGDRVWFHGFVRTIKNTCLEFFQSGVVEDYSLLGYDTTSYSSRMETTIKNVWPLM